MIERCQYPFCGGRLMAALEESLFERGRAGDAELVCLWCGRGPAPVQDAAPRLICLDPGCLKDRAEGSSLCAGHRAVATRRERRVG